MPVSSKALDHHLQSLRAHWSRNRAFPPIAQVAVLLGMASTNGAHKTMARLVDKGFLERVGTRYAPTTRFFALPLLGPVRAGVPQDAEATQTPDTLSVESYLVDNPDKTAYCTVQGDSMCGAGLLDGDIAVVDRSLRARDGDIVVAVVDGEITVKYLHSASGSKAARTSNTARADAWTLVPANPAYEAISPQMSLQVLGVVTGSFRRFRR